MAYILSSCQEDNANQDKGPGFLLDWILVAIGYAITIVVIGFGGRRRVFRSQTIVSLLLWITCYPS